MPSAVALPLVVGGGTAGAVSNVAYTGNLATDAQAYLASGGTSNPFGPWTFFGAPENTSGGNAVDQTDTGVYAPLTQFASQNASVSCGGDAVWYGGTSGGYAVYAPTTVAAGSCGSWNYPAGTFALAPADNSTDAGATWTAPRSGTVSITGSLWDDDPGGGNGILWYVNHNSTELASGGFGNGGNQDINTGAGSGTVAETGASTLGSVKVAAGDTITLLVDPNGDFYYDNTGVQLVVNYDSYSQSVQADSPLSYYRMDDGTGATNLTDSAAVPHEGIYNAGVSLQQPGALAVGDAAAGTPSGGGIGQLPVSAVPASGPRSVEIWEQSTSPGGPSSQCSSPNSDCQTLVSFGSPGTQGGLFQLAESQNQVALFDYGDTLVATSTTNLDDGNWHQIAVSYDGTSVYFYVDGRSIGSATPSFPLDSTAGAVLVGSNPSGSSTWSAPFVGSLDELSIYGTALPASRLLEHYQAGIETATGLTVTAPASATAGSQTSFTVDASDPLGNPAIGYRGTVHFSSTDPQATLPTDYQFSSADQGSHTFAVTFGKAGPETLTVTETGGSGLQATSQTTSVTPGATTGYTIGTPPAATAGSALDVAVTAVDAYGNATPAYAGKVHFTSTDVRATLPADYSFQAADNGTHTFTAGVTFERAGAQRVTATDTVTPAVSSTTSATSVAPAATSQLVVIVPSAATTGSPVNMWVAAADPFGNITPTYTGTVHFTSTDPKATLPADYKFQAADGGTHGFPAGVTFGTAGGQSVTATDTATAAITGTSRPTTAVSTPVPGGGGSGGGGSGGGGATPPSAPVPPSGTNTSDTTQLGVATVSSPGPTTVSATTPSGTRVTVTVPDGALPAGTIIALYKIDPTPYRRPAGEVLVDGYGVSWSPSSAVATSPLTLTVSGDRAIGSGDTVYLINGDESLSPDGSTGPGSFTSAFTTDPGYVVGAPIPTRPPAPVAPPAPAAPGYRLIAGDGGVFAFGAAGLFGSTGAGATPSPVVASVPTADHRGYWTVTRAGTVTAFGDAVSRGDLAGRRLAAPVVGMAATPDGGGYWLVASDGGVFAFGDAPFSGSTGGVALDAPIVGIQAG